MKSDKPDKEGAARATVADKIALAVLVLIVVLAGWSGPGGFLSNAMVTLSKLAIAISAFAIVYLFALQRLKPALRRAGLIGRTAYWFGVIALIAVSIWVGELGQSAIAGWLY